MDFQTFDMMLAAAVGTLTLIFLIALITLILICRRQYRHRVGSWDRLDNNLTRKTKKKLKSNQDRNLAVALGHMSFGNAFDQILGNDQWIDDASGLIPHCLTILRTCHRLTEHLATLVMRPSDTKISPKRLIEAARRVPSRVDDTVKCMYPPLDARLLEARAAALVMTVGQLALLVQNITDKNKQQLMWIDQELEELDNQLMLLRKAALEVEGPEYTNFAKNKCNV